MSRILITGTSRGVGRALAQELDNRGHEVVATARNVSDLDDLNASECLALDVNDPQSIAAAVDRAGRRHHQQRGHDGQRPGRSCAN